MKREHSKTMGQLRDAGALVVDYPQRLFAIYANPVGEVILLGVDGDTRTVNFLDPREVEAAVSQLRRAKKQALAIEKDLRRAARTVKAVGNPGALAETMRASSTPEAPA